MIIIDDGSYPELSLSNIQGKVGFETRIIRNRINLGHQRSIAEALVCISTQIVESDIVCIMDADGEDSPHDLKKLIESAESTRSTVVAKRGYRNEGIIFKFFLSLYRIVFRTVTGYSIDFGNFLAAPGFCVKTLATKSELRIHIAATLLKSKIKINRVLCNKATRYYGTSKLNFSGHTMHGINSFIVFIDLLVVKFLYISSTIAFLSVLLGVITFALKLFGYTLSGWASLVLLISLVIFIGSCLGAVIFFLIAASMKMNNEQI